MGEKVVQFVSKNLDGEVMEILELRPYTKAGKFFKIVHDFIEDAFDNGYSVEMIGMGR